MRLVTYRKGEATQVGAYQDGKILDLSGAGFSDMLSLLSGGEDALARAASALSTAATTDAAQVRLAAPVPRPPKLICIGLNYMDHAKESKMEIPQVPTIFSKFTNTVIGPGDEIVLPASSAKPDYEAEFAFVIGRGGKHIPESRAMEHVFGYTCINDVSARDLQMATTQWLMGKTCDTFCPMGPWIVTKDEIADPHALDIKMTLNGEVVQNSNTRELIFKIPQLVAFLSSVITLEAGDVVSTGTPSGVGFSYKPPKWLKPGDECVVSIAGVGELRNPVAAEGHAAGGAA